MQLTQSQQNAFTKLGLPIPTVINAKDYNYHYKTLAGTLEEIAQSWDGKRNYIETRHDLKELKDCIEDHNREKTNNPKGMQSTDLEKMMALYSVMHIYWNSGLGSWADLKGEVIYTLAGRYPNLHRTMEVWAWG